MKNTRNIHTFITIVLCIKSYMRRTNWNVPKFWNFHTIISYYYYKPFKMWIMNNGSYHIKTNIKIDLKNKKKKGQKGLYIKGQVIGKLIVVK